MALPRSPEDMQRAFVANNGSKVLTGIQKASDRAKKRRAAMSRESKKQAAREGFLDGVKAERLRQQALGSRTYWCEECSRAWFSFEDAWMKLVLHHTIERNEGHGYRDWSDFGVDDPRLLRLLCDDCHKAEHPGPAFGDSPRT